MGAIKALMARVLTMVIGVVCGLVTSRLVISSAGVENYALYSLIAALPALVPFTDLGTGAVLVNSLAAADEDGRGRRLRRQALSVARVMTVFALAIVGVDLALLLFGWWPIVLGAAATSSAAGHVAFVSVLLFAVTVPLGAWSRVLLGVGRNHIVVLVQGVQAPITLFCVWLMVTVGPDSWLPWLAVAAYVAALVVAVIGYAVADKRSQRLLTTSLRQVARVSSRRGAPVMNVGWPMLAQTLTPPVSTQLTRFVVAQSVTAGALAQYGLLMQLLIPLMSLVSTAGLTLWPYYSRARESGAAARSPFLISAVFAAGALVTVGVATLVGPALFSLISENEVEIPAPLVLCFGLQLLAQAVLYPMGMYLMDERGIRFQVIPAVGMAISTVALVAVAAPTIGILAAPLAYFMSTVVCQIIPFAIRIATQRRA